MKKFFVLIAFLAIMGLSSCDKIYDEIAALNDRITELEDTTIAAINEQISNINTSISYLEVVDAELNGYITTLQEVSTKLENEIVDVDTRLTEVQTSLEGQMSAMKSELDNDILTTQADLLAQLQSLKAELEAELEQINATILILKAKDEELEKNITALRGYVDDELEKTADWVAATYSTLEQYELLCSDIATIKAQIETLNNSIVDLEIRLKDKITTDIAAAVETLNTNIDVAVDGMNAEISSQVTAITSVYTTAISSAKDEVTAAYTTEIASAVANLEASMKLWVNEQLTNYYTVAQVDAMLLAMSEEFEGKLTSQKIYLESLISSLSDVLLAKISANGELIVALRNDITSLDAEVAQNAEAIAANAEKIATNANAIKANTDDIIENSKQIEANRGQIESNAVQWAEEMEASAALLTQKIEANTILINDNKKLIEEVDAKIDNTSNVANAKAIAENAKAIADQAELIAKNSVAINNNSTAIAANAVEIESIKEQIVSLEEDITKDYTELIETSIETLEGKLDNSVVEINSRISNEVKSINEAIDALENRVEAVEKEIVAIKGTIESMQGDIAVMQDQISALISRIQSVTYVPKYSDGKVTMNYESKEAELDFVISPKSAVEELAMFWNNILSVKAIYTQTSAVNFIDMPITAFEADYANGVISITVSGENLDESFYTEQQDASAFLQISDGNSNIASEYIFMTPNYNINFEDLKVKAICCKNWDTNGDGELSYAEAAAVTSIGTAFKSDSCIISFDELKYFTRIKTIPASAFEGCTSLWRLIVPDNVISIDKSAFDGCKFLEEIVLPYNLNSIEANAFFRCVSLKAIELPKNLVSIGSNAFGYSGLTEIIVPNNVSLIDNTAFVYCNKVECILIGNGVVEWGSTPFLKCSGKVFCNSSIPDKKPSVNNVFHGASFKKATFGGRAIKIGSYAFDGGSNPLETVILGESVQIISSYAFNVSNLKFVYCKSTTPPQVSADSFKTLSKIYVPIGCAEVYKKASYWTEYASKIEEYDFENNPI